MSFFDSLGNLFGYTPIGMATNTTRNVVNSNVPTAQNPQFLTPDYLQGLESQANSVQNMPVDQSLGYQVLKQAQDQQNAQANALAASARGNVNPALLARMVQRRQAETAGQTAQQAGVLGAQQQIANQELAQRYRQMALGASEEQSRQAIESQRLNAGIQQANLQRQSQLLGSVLGAGATLGAAAMSDGGHVPGHAPVFGDDERNDIVPAMLSPGEIVVPRSKAKDPDKAKAFIDALMKEKSSEDGSGYGKVLAAKRKLKK